MSKHLTEEEINLFLQFLEKRKIKKIRAAKLAGISSSAFHKQIRTKKIIRSSAQLIIKKLRDEALDGFDEVIKI